MSLSVETMVFFLAGAGFGIILTVLLVRPRFTIERARIRALEEQGAADRQRAEAEFLRQKETYERLLADMRMTEDKVQNVFSALATEVLDKNTERFKETAEKDLRQLKTEGVAGFDSRVQVFEKAVEEMKLRLKEANERIASFEKERVDTYARLEEQMRRMSEQEKRLISETDRLKSALTTSGSVRGRWGELVLRNILQSSELMAHIDYEEQSGTRNSEGDDLKPDFIVKLPNAGQHLVIDAKTSLYESYLESEGAKSEPDRRQMHVDFAKKMRKRVGDLSSKEYQKNVAESVPYVIMFVPGEAAIRAAFDADPEIFQFAMDRKVFIASPATIIPLLMLIANAWRQFKMSSQASELSKVVEQIGDRLNLFVERLGKVQKGLESATRAWNEAIDKSWNGQQSVVRAIDKARELGGQIPELSNVETVQVSPRAVEVARDVGEAGASANAETRVEAGALTEGLKAALNSALDRNAEMTEIEIVGTDTDEFRAGSEETGKDSATVALSVETTVAAAVTATGSRKSKRAASKARKSSTATTDSDEGDASETGVVESGNAQAAVTADTIPAAAPEAESEAHRAMPFTASKVTSAPTASTPSAQTPLESVTSATSAAIKAASELF